VLSKRGGKAYKLGTIKICGTTWEKRNTEPQKSMNKRSTAAMFRAEKKRFGRGGKKRRKKNTMQTPETKEERRVVLRRMEFVGVGRGTRGEGDLGPPFGAKTIKKSESRQVERRIYE